ncbi:MAG: tetratricopeptide repeat protein [Flavobacteriales bacterium]|nr:tetratricopeptide repeat protein [Flavobacteriales bacterium]
MKVRSLNLMPAALALAFLVTVAYWNHFHNAFHFDDSHVIQNNAAIKDLSLWKTYFTDGTTHSSLPTNQGYRPLLTLSFAVDHWLAGRLEDTFHFHLSTFLWFMLQGVLMFFLFLHIMDRAARHALNPWTALFAVGLYMLHTVNAETINYISARSDVLSTVPVVAGLLIFAKAGGWKRHLGLLPVAAGILIKQPAVMYLPIMLAYFALFDLKKDVSGSLHPKNWPLLLKWALPATAVCLGLFMFTQRMTPDTWVPGGNSAFNYAITQPFVILRYFWLFFVPVGLSADSDWEPLDTMADSRFFFGVIFLVAIGLVIVRSSRTEGGRPIAFGLLWFLFALIPTSSIIPLSEVTNDHRMFFPFVGLTLALTWAIARWFYARMEAGPRQFNYWRNIALLAIALLYGAHTFGVVQRNRIWHTSDSLWLDVTIKSPKNGRGLMNYGLALMRQGDIETAMRYYRKALSTNYRNHPYLYVNMASAQNALGHVQEAEQLYRTALEKGPGYPDCHYFYAKWLYDNNRLSEAEFYAKEALRLSPAHEYARGLLGLMEASTGTLLQQAERLAGNDPTPENYLNLSLQLYRSERFEDCIKACERALELRPDYADAWNNICSAHNAMGQWKLGIAACEKALAIRPDHQLARNNLNWAKKELGS